MSLVTVSGQTGSTNEWIKTSSGYWEEPFWSLGVLPSVAQKAVAFRNPGWKALAIGANTTANYPASLRVNDLIIDAPTNSANRLLLNWAGLSVPLVVRSNLIIGTNGSLASHSSDLRAANVELRGFAAFSDSARATLTNLAVASGGALNLNDATLTCSNMGFWVGSVTQSMGVAVISHIYQLTRGFYLPGVNTYVLSGGVLYSGVANIGYYGSSGSDVFKFFQSGGVHTNSSMSLAGGQRRQYLISHAGYYYLSGGLLVSDQTRINAGVMEQRGGTNLTRELIIAYGGYYTLSGGQLVTSNITASTVDRLGRGIHQSGGSHTVQGRLTLEREAGYSLSAGTLSAPVIEIKTYAGLGSFGGEVSNSGMVVLRGGSISVGDARQQFGKLQVLKVDEPYWPDIPSALYLYSTNGPTVIRFADSRDVPWSETLYIHNWSTNHAGNGPDRIFVGTSSQALTRDQLRQIIFIRPSGLPSDYTAALTAAGEVVPGLVHDYDYVVTNGAVTITRYTGPGGNITVPSTIENLSVTVIGNRAFNPTFETIRSLTSVTLPDTITNIGEQAFHYCKGLTNVNLGNGVIRIGNFAFEDCDSLSAITIPASVREIGAGVFESCDSFVAITVHPDNLVYSSLDGVLFNKTQTRLIQFPWRKGGAYAVPETVRSIENGAFYGCYYLSNVTLSGSVTNIGDGAFQFCVGLTNIAIPEGVRTLGAFAFWHCISLTNIILPDSLTSIGARAFEQSALIRAEIGRGIASFGGAHYFAYCPNLIGIYFRGDAPVVISEFQDSTPNVTIYYLPGTVGWGATFAGRPSAPWYLPKPHILDFGPSFGVRTNRFGFTISWATNAVVVIEASTNVIDWSVISTNPPANGSSYFNDAQWTNQPIRFYRLRAL